jgi:acyl-CoA oxidase
MPATQTTLFPNLSEAYALHFLTRDLIEQSQNDGSRDLETLAAAVKARASDFAFNTVDDARKKAGGEGYVAKYKLGMMRNDVDIFRTFEGDNTVLRLLVAKNLLDDLKQSFKEKSATDRFMEGLNLQFNTLSARYTLDKFHTTSKHLLHPEFHKRIFNLREKALRLNLAKKIVKLKKKFGSTKTAFDLCQKEALELADAYTTKMMVKKFSETIKAEQDPQTKAALTDLYDLFVIHNMAKKSGWLLENGFMSARQTFALNRIERQINKKISANALDFVNAFSVPEKMLPPLPPSNMESFKKLNNGSSPK